MAMVLENFLHIKKAYGRNGKIIKIYKIRTMIPDAEQHLDKVVSNGFDRLGKPNHDYRVTKFGKILRRYYFDEIPSLLNLVMGDIVLVGVRPHSKENWGYYPKSFKEKALKYKPGLFGVGYSDKNIKSFEDLIRVQEEYLKQKETSPLLTDINYFFKIIWNISFGGLRSK